MTTDHDHVTTTLGAVTMDDQGKEVLVTSNYAAIRGTLTSIEFDQEWVDITTIGTPPEDRPEQIPGVRTARISVGEWTAENLPLNTPVEIWR